MANYMFVLRPSEKVHRIVCPECSKRGEVLNTCKMCHGQAYVRKRVPCYYVQDRPIEITHIDRDSKTGILRYWEGACDFYYETLYPKLNPHVPEVPHGVHLCHDTYLSAKTECERINKYLLENKVESSRLEEESIQTGKFNF